MNKHIFVINGSGGVGKDTFVNIVAKYAPTLNYSSVDKVKDVAKLIGWDGGKTEKDRKLLSDLKVLASDYNDMPYESIKSKIQSFLDDSINNFLFIHIREPREIQRVVENFGALSILVTRPQVKHITSNMADENVYKYEYDIIVDNSGDFNQLNEAAKKFVEEYL